MMAGMTTDEVIRYYRSAANVARALHIKDPSVSVWGKHPPPLRQLQLQALSGGLLKAEPNVMPEVHAANSAAPTQPL